MVSFYDDNHAGLRYLEKYRDKNGKWQVHRGYDLKGHKANTKIPSPFVGRVVARGFDGAYGRYVTVRLAPTRWGHLCHMAEQTPLAIGEDVAIGEVAGLVGNTGSFASGYHLHVMVTTSSSLRGSTVDPRPYIEFAREREEDMPLTPEQDAKLTSVFNAFFNITPAEWLASGTSNGVGRMLAQTQVSAQMVRDVNFNPEISFGTGKNVSNAIKEVLEAVRTNTSDSDGSSINYDLLAEAIAPKVVDLLATRLAS